MLDVFFTSQSYGAKSDAVHQHNSCGLRALGYARYRYVPRWRLAYTTGGTRLDGRRVDDKSVHNRKRHAAWQGSATTERGRVYYGYLAERAPGELAAVIRGTDDFVEWVEDAEFRAIPYTPRIPLPATQTSILVEQGFWTLYASMQLISPTGAALGALAPAITNTAGSPGMVTVVLSR